MAFFIAVDSFRNTEHSKERWPFVKINGPLSRNPTESDDEVDRVAENFTSLWLAPTPRDVSMPQTSLQPRE